MSGVSLPYPSSPLSDGRIRVRPWAEEDLDCVRAASSDPVIPEGTTIPATFTEEEGLAFIHRQWSRADDGVGVSQAVVDVTTGRAIGLVVVSLRPQPHVGGLGYWIIPAARGRGAATAAIRMVAPWALQALDLRRLEAWVAPDNHASQRVLVNAGFEPEGRLRNFLATDGEASDALVYSRIPPQ